MRRSCENEVRDDPSAIAVPSGVTKGELRNDESENYGENDRVCEGSVPAEEPEVAPSERSSNCVKIR